MASPRRDRRTKTGDDWGKPNVTFPLADDAAPVVEETDTVRQNAANDAFGSAHPDTDQYPNAFLVDRVTSPGQNTDKNLTETYHTLPGTVLTEKAQDDEYSLPFTKTTQAVKASTATAAAPTQGQNTKFEPVNAVESTKIVETLDPTIMGAFYIPYIGSSQIDLPRVLVSLTAVWNVTTGTGVYNESGSGATAGDTAALSLSSTGRGQGSASVLPEVIPVFAEPPFGEVDIVDYFFFLPNPVRKAAALAAVSAFATDFLGVSTTVLPWPVWKPKSETLVVSGQKVSLSAEATARSAVSISSSTVSSAQSSGEGENYDLGSSVRAIALSPCLHIPLEIIGGTLNSSVANASASAVITGSGGFPGASATPTPLVKTAFGGISPATLGGTTPQTIPKTGVYAYRINVENYRLGWSVVRVRTFDFEIISFPQVTEVEFGSLTGANFVTHTAAAAFVIPTQSNGILAIWINTGTETIPDLSEWGVTTYFQELISPTETTAGIASKMISQLASGLSPNFTLSLGADSTSVFFTSVAKGVQAEAFDINTGAQFFTIQQGS